MNRKRDRAASSLDGFPSIASPPCFQHLEPRLLLSAYSSPLAEVESWWDIRPDAPLVDAGDYYWHDGVRKELLRVSDEILLDFAGHGQEALSEILDSPNLLGRVSLGSAARLNEFGEGVAILRVDGSEGLRVDDVISEIVSANIDWLVEASYSFVGAEDHLFKMWPFFY